MQLDGANRKKLIDGLTQHYDFAALDILLDGMDVVLKNIVVIQDIWRTQCLTAVRWMHDNGRMEAFLIALKKEDRNPYFIAIIDELLPILQMPIVAASGSRPHTVAWRPVLDRVGIWSRLDDYAKGTAGKRILAVKGGTGKSYSVWPLSAACDPKNPQAPRMKPIDLTESKALNIDAEALGGMIRKRLVGASNGVTEPALAQPARTGKYVITEIVQLLEGQSELTWLVIDEVNKVNLDETALDLLSKVCQAIDIGSCPNVRLFLLGLDPDKLNPSVATYVPVDVVTRPTLQDIEDYVLWFATDVKKPQTGASVAGIVDELDWTLGAIPGHDEWSSFHKRLREKCDLIAKGALP